MRRTALITALQAAAALAASSAAAQVVSERADTVAVTIYREGDARTAEFEDLEDFAEGGLALITESRTLDLPAGRQTMSFRGVVDGMVPETAALEGLSGGVAERNYDFDLLSPGNLLARSVGERVRLVRTNRTTGAVEEREAIVRSGPHGVMLQTADGFEALGCGGLTEKVVFDRAPEGLSDRATLSAVVDVLKPGRHTVRLSYLATGFNWSADYVARLSADGKSLDLTGWITLANGGGTTLVDAPTQVVAGDLSRDDETRAPARDGVWIEARCWPEPYRRGPARLQVREPQPVASAPPPGMDLEDSGVEEVVVTGSRMAAMSELGDYKLYTLPEPTTVAARQAKQVRFLDEAKVPVERIYAASIELSDLSEDGDEALDATVLLRMKNAVAAGLGKPLPGGVVAVMEADGRGRPVLAGEAELDDTAVGLPVELEIGRAIDVTVVPKLVSEREFGRLGRERVRYEVEVALINAKPVPVTVEVAHEPDGESGLRVASESVRHVMKDGAPVWPVRLKAGERRVLRYTLEVDG